MSTVTQPWAFAGSVLPAALDSCVHLLIVLFNWGISILSFMDLCRIVWKSCTCPWGPVWARKPSALHNPLPTSLGWLPSLFGKQTPAGSRSCLSYGCISSGQSSANFSELLDSKYFSLCNTAGPCLHLILREPSKCWNRAFINKWMFTQFSNWAGFDAWAQNFDPCDNPRTKTS